MSQQQLANASSLHRVTVSRLETGKHDMGVSYLRALAAALGVDPGQLFDTTDGEPAGSRGLIRRARSL